MNGADDNWFFSASSPWPLSIDCAPQADEPMLTWSDRAMPKIVADLERRITRPSVPCMVVAHTTVRHGGAPLGRAKPLLDCLHDSRGGRRYADYGLGPPLGGDEPQFVSGLAVEVRKGAGPFTEWLLGDTLVHSGTRVGPPVDVPVSAPNAVAGDARERQKLAQLQAIFDRALMTAWRNCDAPDDPGEAVAVVISHHPQRDEDNTWESWLKALRHTWRTRNCGWNGWKAKAVASVVDDTINTPVRYEFFAAGPPPPMAPVRERSPSGA